jgi:aspartate racemase
MVSDMGGVLGVLGGMGPLASARFLENIYRHATGGREQELPRVLVDSDPGIPDRTETILAGRDGDAGGLLEARLDALRAMGATRLVVACFTAHHFLRRVRPDLRSLVVSLVTTAVAEVAGAPGTFLLLCTDGSRRAGIFPREDGWPRVAHRVVLPDEIGQRSIHRLIYRIKQGAPGPGVVAEVDLLRRRYECSGVILGCTEFHLVAPDLIERYGRPRVVDALLSVAEHLGDLLAAPELAARS